VSQDCMRDLCRVQDLFTTPRFLTLNKQNSKYDFNHEENCSLPLSVTKVYALASNLHNKTPP